MVSLPDKDLVVTPLQHGESLISCQLQAFQVLRAIITLAQALRAARTFTLAFANDPLMRYLTNVGYNLALGFASAPDHILL